MKQIFEQKMNNFSPAAHDPTSSTNIWIMNGLIDTGHKYTHSSQLITLFSFSLKGRMLCKEFWPALIPSLFFSKTHEWP